MNYYENFVLIEPSLPDEEIDQVSAKIQGEIKKGGGEIIREDRWGRRKLAYELNKKSQGYYILYTFKAPPEMVSSLEKFYRVYEPVFKFMIIKLGKKEIAALQEQLKGSTTVQES